MVSMVRPTTPSLLNTGTTIEYVYVVRSATSADGFASRNWWALASVTSGRFLRRVRHVAADARNLPQRRRPSCTSVGRHQLDRELLQEEADVGHDAAGLRGAAVGKLGDGGRVDVDAHEGDRRREDVARCHRVQHGRHHQAEADTGELGPHRT